MLVVFSCVLLLFSPHVCSYLLVFDACTISWTISRAIKTGNSAISTVQLAGAFAHCPLLSERHLYLSIFVYFIIVNIICQVCLFIYKEPH